MKKITVATEQDGNEALYVDGKLDTSDSTIYACDIAEAAAGEPCIISHRTVDLASELFPANESDLVDSAE